jgi:hypothetical protein
MWTSGAVAEFDTRVRSVLAPALQLALSGTASGPDLIQRGVERYEAAIGGGPWDQQEWIYQFDPDSEFCGWAWWDLTHSSDREARIWVDTWGESFFACDELRWLAYVSGGEEVRGRRW